MILINLKVKSVIELIWHIRLCEKTYGGIIPEYSNLNSGWNFAILCVKWKKKIKIIPSSLSENNSNNSRFFFLGQRTSRQAMVEDSGFLSNHNCTR